MKQVSVLFMGIYTTDMRYKANITEFRQRSFHIFYESLKMSIYTGTDKWMEDICFPTCTSSILNYPSTFI